MKKPLLSLILGLSIVCASFSFPVTQAEQIPNQAKLDRFVDTITSYQSKLTDKQYKALLEKSLDHIDLLLIKYANNKNTTTLLEYLKTELMNEKIIFLEKQIKTIQQSSNSKKITLGVIIDKRCTNCHNDALVEQIKALPFLKDATITILDYSDKKAKGILDTNGIKFLPAVLLNTNQVDDPSFAQYLEKTPAGLYSLNVGASFDPNQEVCDNKIDDNADGKIDCDDKKCAEVFTCAPKVDRPVADLYIMSYCPYGLQAQKGYLEVMDKLGKVADINVKFVPYIMHEQKEADENVVQYCIQKEQKETYLPYLKCFLKKEGQAEACLKTAKVNNDKLQACITSTKKEFKVDEKMGDKSKQFPDFDIDREEALKAGVEGSPTFVVNGIKIEDVGRNAKEYAQKICSTFKVKPKECDAEFQDVNFDPMFGFTSKGENANAGCGQ